MATPVKMPKMGINMEEGTLVRFLVAEGAAVKKDEPLFEIETDKTSMEINAPDDGVLLKILGEDDEVYDCGTVLAVLGQPGGDMSEYL